MHDPGTFYGKPARARVDFHVPAAAGRFTDDTRLRSALTTIKRLNAGGAKVLLLAHFERPKGKRVPEMSLHPVVEPLAALLGKPVAFADDCVGPGAQRAVGALPHEGVLLLENVRFHPGEEANDPAFAAQLAELADFYVNDAFSAAHRAHASTEAIAHVLPAYAGEALRRELTMLNKALGSPERPVMGIVGGSKVSTKLDLLNNLVGKLDRLAIGGGMANTFLFAQGHDIGGSLAERDMADTARSIMATAARSGCELLLPLDVVVSDRVEPGAPAIVRALGEVGPQDKILDAGPETLKLIRDAIDGARTLIWNGPLGVFEIPPFDHATVEAARFAARHAKTERLIAVAGGGDTVAALNHAGVAEDFTFVSTAGGAFLEWMEGKTLPGVAALEKGN